VFVFAAREMPRPACEDAGNFGMTIVWSPKEDFFARRKIPRPAGEDAGNFGMRILLLWHEA